LGDINDQCLFHRSKIIIFQACSSSPMTNSSSLLLSAIVLSSAGMWESEVQGSLLTSSSNHKLVDTLLPHLYSDLRQKKLSTAALERPRFAPEITKLLRRFLMDLKIGKQRRQEQLQRREILMIDSFSEYSRHLKIYANLWESKALIWSRASISMWTNNFDCQRYSIVAFTEDTEPHLILLFFLFTLFGVINIQTIIINDLCFFLKYPKPQIQRQYNSRVEFHLQIDA